MRRSPRSRPPGGGDLNPACYAQAPDGRNEVPDDLQDEFDLAVIRTVLGSAVSSTVPGLAGRGRAVPALAICRGLQVLNVACGGTLRQHVGGGPVPHEGGLHEVTIARGSRLRTRRTCSLRKSTVRATVAISASSAESAK